MKCEGSPTPAAQDVSQLKTVCIERVRGEAIAQVELDVQPEDRYPHRRLQQKQGEKTPAGPAQEDRADPAAAPVPDAARDRLELLESIMFGMQITMSARLIIEFLTMGAEGANGMGLSAIVGYVLAWFLLGYMIFIMLKYLVYLHALTFHTTPDDRHRAFQAWIRKEHYTLRNNRGENIEGIGEDEVSAIRWPRH